MKKYDNYKDSGIEWIGEIPEHWEVKPFKHLVICNSEALTEKTNPEMEINYIEIGDVNSFDGIKETSKYTFEKAPSRARRIVREGDVIISTVRTYLKAITSISSKFDGFIASTGFAVLTPKLIHSGFLGNIALCEGLIGEIISLSKGVSYPSITSQDLTNISIPFPSKNEQNAIANYLDHKTTQIDTLIAKKEQFISLLQEERTAVINQAVTKGLDPKVKMKDSGIEWLGEIPEHWEVAKFNLYVSIRHGHQFMNHDFTDDGVKVVKITQLHKDGYLDLSKCSYVSSEQLENYQSILIKEKDILMCLTGGTIGKIIRVGEVNEPLLQNYRVGHFSSGKASKISDDFIFWLMSSESIVSQIFFQMRETGQPNIGMDDFGRMRITIPPLMEQEKIVKHIVNKTVEISEILIKSKQEIELLKEYKTALISEVVTGKVDVRDVILN